MIFFPSLALIIFFHILQIKIPELQRKRIIARTAKQSYEEVKNQLWTEIFAMPNENQNSFDIRLEKKPRNFTRANLLWEKYDLENVIMRNLTPTIALRIVEIINQLEMEYLFCIQFEIYSSTVEFSFLKNWLNRFRELKNLALSDNFGNIGEGKAFASFIHGFLTNSEPNGNIIEEARFVKILTKFL